ncbi:hypothetical protein [Hathewaya massiliensis]|uniref:hypothetical protein n=1 Tax=Hathewaya massiliensis TaxID=1964382 RepID=UPI00163BDCA0|nr:hypothetical protein [Hathewaya massiliensis]
MGTLVYYSIPIAIFVGIKCMTNIFKKVQSNKNSTIDTIYLTIIISYVIYICMAA